MPKNILRQEVLLRQNFYSKNVFNLQLRKIVTLDLNRRFHRSFGHLINLLTHPVCLLSIQFDYVIRHQIGLVDLKK